MGNLHAQLTAAGIPVSGISIGRNDDRSTWRVDFAPEATDEQKAQAAQIVAAFDLPKIEHNEGIDTQIRAIEAIYRMTERAQREGHYGTALLADALNVIVGQIEAALRTIPGQEGLALARLPDLKQNAGMKKIKAAEDLIKPLRQQRLP